MKNFVKIKYHAYNSLDFAPDAEGWVEESKIKDPEIHPWYVKEDNHHGYVARDGHVLTMGDYSGVVKKTDIYTEVWEDSRLNTGWACSSPTGGYAAAPSPDIQIRAIDPDTGEEADIHLHHSCW